MYSVWEFVVGRNWLFTVAHALVYTRNLMAPDDFKNLGLVFDEDKNKTASEDGGTAPAGSSNSTAK